MNFHIEYRIPYIDKIVFVGKLKQEVCVGFGRTSLTLGRWFAYIERP